MRIQFYSLTQSDLQKEMLSRGHSKFRADQLFRWVYGLGVTDFSKMSNIAAPLRKEFADLFDLSLPTLLRKHESSDGTRKYLMDMGDGLSVEAVMIPGESRNTLCLSSEVGCNMACTFCYTGKQKLKKKLAVHQILGQYVQAQKDVGFRISNIVFMGMGEPLDNPESVFPAIEIFHSPWGFNLSKKKITVSTSGLVHRIPLVTASGVRLAVSLNATEDSLRNEIMPINKRWPIEELLAACRQHARETRDKVTFEYVLLRGVNDSLADAKRLHKITQSVPCKINIIPFNEHPSSSFQRPTEEEVQKFHTALMDLGSHVLRRKTMGRDILAACGQLTSQRGGLLETQTDCRV